MKITLKDGSFKEYGQPMAAIDIAKDISEGLAAISHPAPKISIKMAAATARIV